jgi:hypothetical protein
LYTTTEKTTAPTEMNTMRVIITGIHAESVELFSSLPPTPGFTIICSSVGLENINSLY